MRFDFASHSRPLTTLKLCEVCWVNLQHADWNESCFKTHESIISLNLSENYQTYRLRARSPKFKPIWRFISTCCPCTTCLHAEESVPHNHLTKPRFSTSFSLRPNSAALSPNLQPRGRMYSRIYLATAINIATEIPCPDPILM